MSVNGTTEAGETRYRPSACPEPGRRGAQRYSSGQPLTSYQYTGQRAEAGLGLYYYGARWYDRIAGAKRHPALGRFIGCPLGADTIVPNPGDAQSFDRYAYGLNNPLRYSDPTGHYSRDEIIQHFGCEANDWSCVDRQFHQNNVDSPYRGKGDWLQILIDAVDGDPISARNSQYAAVMQGKFLRNPETGKIEIQMMLPDGQLTGPLPELTFVNYGAGHQRYSLESAKYNTHVGQLYYLPGVCGTVWDCTAIQLDAASLLFSAGGDALITCIPESLGLCGGGAIVAKAADRAVTYAAVLHTADMIYQGKAGPVDAAMVGVSTRFSTRPVLGEVFGITQLLYDLVVDPITPGW